VGALPGERRPYWPKDKKFTTSETIQHTLYGGLLMPFAVLGAMTYVAKRNVHHDEDDDDDDHNSPAATTGPGREWS
jgi:hypothetical protein